MSHNPATKPRSMLGGWRFAACLLGGLAMVAASTANAGPQRSGGDRGGRGSLANSSVAGTNNNFQGRGGDRVNNGNINNGNINIGNDVNVDIDRDYHGGYYHGHGHYPYRPVAAGIVIGAVAVTTAAVVGSYYRSLPAGCTVVVKNGVQYHYCGTVYYQKTWYGNDVVYVVATP